MSEREGHWRGDGATGLLEDAGLYSENVNLALGALAQLLRREFAPLRLGWAVTWGEGEPWVNVRVTAAEPCDATVDLPRRYAIWRETLAVHLCEFGAVIDPPVLEPPWPS